MKKLTRCLLWIPFIAFCVLVMLGYMEEIRASEAQQIVSDVQTVTPYVWEIVAICMIFVSLTITQRVKKVRWFPRLICNKKLSRPKEDGSQYEYYQLKTCILDTLAIVQTFVYVSGSLYIRYQQLEVLIIGFVACVLQWKIIKIIFLKAEQKESSQLAKILKGDLYVHDEATIFEKIGAFAAGGGVEKKR